MNAHQRRIYQRKHFYKVKVPACGYWHGGTIECRGDGHMWDADADGFDPDDTSMPCPDCNLRGWLDAAKEEAETVSSYSSNGSHGTGESMWRFAVAKAEELHPIEAKKELQRIGKVVALNDNDEVVFEYA